MDSMNYFFYRVDSSKLFEKFILSEPNVIGCYHGNQTKHQYEPICNVFCTENYIFYTTVKSLDHVQTLRQWFSPGTHVSYPSLHQDFDTVFDFVDHWIYNALPYTHRRKCYLCT